MIVKPSVTFLTADSNSNLVTDTTTVLTSMDGNVNYTLASPPLADVEAAKGNFVTSMADAADGGKTLKTEVGRQKSEVGQILTGTNQILTALSS
jgi:hypothetical protein